MFHNGPQVGVLRRPAQPLPQLFRGGYQIRRIAFAARAHGVRHSPAGYFLHRADRFHDAVAGSRADVELVRSAAGDQVLQRQDMRLRQIVHVDVVADAGAIGRGVIVAKDGDGLAG